MQRAKSKDFVEDSGVDDTGFTKVEFPDEMMGNWFHYDPSTYEYGELEFRDNRLISWSIENISVAYGYDGTKRPAADQQMFDDPTSINATAEARQKAWMAVNVAPSWQGIKNLVNIRGWYQSAGAGSSYYVTEQSSGGQRFDVLTEASGAGVWTDTHWFRSITLAEANANAHFDSDIDRPTD